MQQDNHLAQEIIGSPAHLLKVRFHRTVAFIDLSSTESLQRTVSLKLMQQVALRHRAGTIELECPHIALSGLSKDLFKTQRQTPTVLVVGKGIGPPCASRIVMPTVLSRRIPHGSRLTFGEYTLTLRQFGCIGLK